MFKMQLVSHIVDLIGGFPVFLVWLIGLWLCFSRARMHPKACMLMGTALVIIAGDRVFRPFIWGLISAKLLPDRPGIDVGTLFLRFIVSFVLALPMTAAWTLALWVIFRPGGYDNQTRTEVRTIVES